jgi:phosphonate transport system substrate-binding protein
MALLTILAAVAISILAGCTRDKGPIGSETNPIKLFFVPSVEAQVLEDTSKLVRAYLESHTPYKFSVGTPTSYISVVEAFGTKRADVASLNTFGYILAHQKYGVQAKLTVVRHGASTYKAQIVARNDSSINSLADLKGKKFAYVDPASTSGYLMPAKLFKDKAIELGETVWASKHDNVISMVYQKQVDAGATFYSPPEDGVIQDARRLVQQQYPDVEKKIKIVTLTDSIPNDPIVFRKDLPEEIKETISQAILDYISTEEGREAFFKLYGVTAFKKSSDKDYDSVRSMLIALGQDPSALAAKK